MKADNRTFRQHGSALAVEIESRWPGQGPGEAQEGLEEE
jgi:hypothetical protein